MKTNKHYLMGIMMATLFGCGSSSDEGSSGGTPPSAGGSGQYSPTKGAWVLGIDDKQGFNTTMFGVAHGGYFYAVESMSLAGYGTIQSEGTQARLALDIDGVTHDLRLGRYSAQIYIGDYGSGTVQLMKYGDDNRDQGSVVGVWRTSDNSLFTITDLGTYSFIHPSSGCLLNGMVTYIEQGAYTLNGTAQYCIDGELDGPFKGAGMMPTNTQVNGIDMRLLSWLFVHSNAPGQKGRVPLTATIEN